MSTLTDTTVVGYDVDGEKIATLTFDDPSSAANTMSARFKQDFADVLDRLAADVEAGSVIGAVVASAKDSFFAGGNVKALLEVGPADAERLYVDSLALKATLRRLETIGVPVVAAINGAALGGGYEICLATHHRIAVDDRKVQIGLPEVTLGLLAGAGGVVRTVRKFGVFKAINEILTTGTRFTVAAALEKGLIDEVVASQDDLLPAAKAWLLDHAEAEEAAIQPWDRPGYKIPGGAATDRAISSMLPGVPGNVRKAAKGVPYPAPRAIISAAVEGAQIDFAGAEQVEARYFVNLATGRVAKAMIQAFFFDIQRASGGGDRPAGYDKRTVTKVAVLGAGMMGAGIAYAAASAGIDVVLKDVTFEAAERGKAYSEKLLAKAQERGRSTPEKAAQLLARITPTADVDALEGCDCVVEAVFEDPELKKKLFAEIEGVVAPNALLGSNTSTLPITDLAEGVTRQADFIGMHFFSPADKMPIVEVIRGEKTTDETLARTIDFVLQLRKIPIVVNDSRGFYTSRIIGVRINEGLAMIAEGVAPWTVERATLQAGYPVGALQLCDELNLELMAKVAAATKAGAEADGREWVEKPGAAVVPAMVAAGRAGRLRGAGFYDYDEAGERQGIWAGLADLFPVAADLISFVDARDRLLFAETLEAAKCFGEGVIESAAAANIGAIMAIGFPGITGGPATFMTNYEGGLAGFVARADALADVYGERFRPSAWLRAKAAAGEGFPA